MMIFLIFIFFLLPGRTNAAVDDFVHVCFNPATSIMQDGVAVSPSSVFGISGGIDSIRGIAFQYRTGTIFITESGGHRIRHIQADGSGWVSTVAGDTFGNTPGDVDGSFPPGAGGFTSQVARLNRPSGIVFVDSQSAFYFCDSFNHKVKIFSTPTTATFAGTGTGGSTNNLARLSSMFNYPTGITFSRNIIFACDTENNAIKKVLIAINVVTNFATLTDAASFVVYRNKGYALSYGDRIGTSYQHAVFLVSLQSGNSAVYFGSATVVGNFVSGAAKTAWRMNRPCGLTLDCTRHDMYVAECVGQVIKKYNFLSDSLEVYAGNYLTSTPLNGGPVNRLAAAFGAPRAMLVATQGTGVDFLWLTDVPTSIGGRLSTIELPTDTRRACGSETNTPPGTFSVSRTITESFSDTLTQFPPTISVTETISESSTADFLTQSLSKTSDNTDADVTGTHTETRSVELKFTSTQTNDRSPTNTQSDTDTMSDSETDIYTWTKTQSLSDSKNEPSQTASEIRTLTGDLSSTASQTVSLDVTDMDSQSPGWTTRSLTASFSTTFSATKTLLKTITQTRELSFTITMTMMKKTSATLSSGKSQPFTSTMSGVYMETVIPLTIDGTAMAAPDAARPVLLLILKNDIWLPETVAKLVSTFIVNNTCGNKYEGWVMSKKEVARNSLVTLEDNNHVARVVLGYDFDGYLSVCPEKLSVLGDVSALTGLHINPYLAPGNRHVILISPPLVVSKQQGVALSALTTAASAMAAGNALGAASLQTMALVGSMACMSVSARRAAAAKDVAWIVCPLCRVYEAWGFEATPGISYHSNIVVYNLFLLAGVLIIHIIVLLVFRLQKWSAQETWENALATTRFPSLSFMVFTIFLQSTTVAAIRAYYEESPKETALSTCTLLVLPVALICVNFYVVRVSVKSCYYSALPHDNRFYANALYSGMWLPETKSRAFGAFFDFRKGRGYFNIVILVYLTLIAVIVALPPTPWFCHAQLGLVTALCFLMGVVYFVCLPMRSTAVSVCRGCAVFAQGVVPLCNVLASPDSPWIAEATFGANTTIYAMILLETFFVLWSEYSERMRVEVTSAPLAVEDDVPGSPLISNPLLMAPETTHEEWAREYSAPAWLQPIELTAIHGMARVVPPPSWRDALLGKETHSPLRTHARFEDYVNND